MLEQCRRPPATARRDLARAARAAPSCRTRGSRTRSCAGRARSSGRPSRGRGPAAATRSTTLAADRDRAVRSARSKPASMRSGRLAAARTGPTRTRNSPSCDLEVEVVDGRDRRRTACRRARSRSLGHRPAASGIIALIPRPKVNAPLRCRAGRDQVEHEDGHREQDRVRGELAEVDLAVLASGTGRSRSSPGVSSGFESSTSGIRNAPQALMNVDDRRHRMPGMRQRDHDAQRICRLLAPSIAAASSSSARHLVDEVLQQPDRERQRRGGEEHRRPEQRVQPVELHVTSGRRGRAASSPAGRSANRIDEQERALERDVPARQRVRGEQAAARS